MRIRWLGATLLALGVAASACSSDENDAGGASGAGGQGGGSAGVSGASGGDAGSGGASGSSAGDGGAAGTGGSDDGGATPCNGVKPPQSAFGAMPGPVRFTDGGLPLDGGADGGGGAGGSGDGGTSCATCVGSPAPAWQLEDFQPQSCGFDAVYGLPVFKGKVTVAALLAGW